MATIIEHLKAVVGADISGYETAMQRVTKTANKVGRGMQRAGKIGLLVFGGLGIAALKYASSFEKAVGEIETIIDTNVEDIGAIRQSILDLSQTMGIDATQLAKGYYQTISAGITDTKDAMVVMTQATKLSIATLTDQETAVDVITSALNAYGLAASEATRISDVLFTTVRLGKTRLNQLGGALGRVMPIAAQLNVSFEELNAHLVGLTLSGLNTNEAVTGLRALMINIIKPSNEAAAYAKQLGLEWDMATLKSKGLTYMMTQLSEAMKDENFNITKLIQNVRALPAALIAAGAGAEAIADAFRDMKDAAGETETALQKQMDKLWKELQTLWTNAKVALIELGTAITPTVKRLVQQITIIAKGVARWVVENEKLAVGILKWGFIISGANLIIGKLIVTAVIAVTTLKALGTVSFAKAILGAKGLAIAVTAVGVAAKVAGAALVGLAVGYAAQKYILKPIQEATFKRIREEKEGIIELEAVLLTAARATRILAKAGEDLKPLPAPEETIVVHQPTWSDPGRRILKQDKENIKLYRERINRLEIWSKVANKVKKQMLELGMAEAESNRIMTTSSTAQLKALNVQYRNILERQAQEAQNAKDRIKLYNEQIQVIQRLGIEVEAMTQETAVAYRTYYGELKSQLQEYESALKQAQQTEQSIADQRRRFADETRSSLLRMETARDDPTVRRKKYLAEAVRLEKVAAEQIKAENIKAAMETWREASRIYTSLHSESIAAEKQAKGRRGKGKERETSTAALTGYKRIREEIAKQLQANEALAAAATHEARNDLLRMEMKIEELRDSAAGIQVTLETETAEAAVARLRESLISLREEHATAIGWAREYSQPRPGEAVGARGAGVAVAAPATTTISNDIDISITLPGVKDPKKFVKELVPILDRRYRRRQSG